MVIKNRSNTSVLYAFTITLQPKLYKLKPEEQYDKTYMHVAKLLKSMNTDVDLIAELTRSANLHMHGIIRFKNFKPKTNLMVMFHNSFRNDSFVGFVNIKQITDEKKWLDYIMKDVNTTLESIHRPPIILNEIHIKKYENNIIDFPYMYQIELIDEQ